MPLFPPRSFRPSEREAPAVLSVRQASARFPAASAEQFVRAFARQADGRAALLDGRAEQQQRGVYVRHAGQSARFGGRAERSADRLRVEHDAVMMRAEKIRHQRRKIAVIGRLEAVFDLIP